MHDILWTVSLAVLLLPAGSNLEEKKRTGERTATIIDRKGTSTAIEDPRFVHSKRSLFGETEVISRHFTVRHGEATIKIAFEKVKSLSVTKVEGEWLHVRVEYREGKPADFKMKNEGFLRGDSKYGEYELRFAEIKKVSLSVKKAKAPSGG